MQARNARDAVLMGDESEGDPAMQMLGCLVGHESIRSALAERMQRGVDDQMLGDLLRSFSLALEPMTAGAASSPQLQQLQGDAQLAAAAAGLLKRELRGLKVGRAERVLARLHAAALCYWGCSRVPCR